MAYQDFKNQMLARTVGLDIDGSGDFDCVDIAKAYALNLYGNFTTIIGYGNAVDLWGKISETYFTKIANNPADPNQLPLQGDIMVFGATPKVGYTNQYNNPYGHIGVCDAVNGSGYTLLQQASGTGNKPWLQYQPWNFRPCLGWYRPKAVSNPTPQGGVDIMNQEAGTELYRTALFREPESPAGASQWNGQSPAVALRAVRGAEWQLLKGRLQSYDTLQAQVAELSARPTKAELEAVVQTANTERDKIAVLETALAEEKAKPPVTITVTTPVDEKVVVQNILVRFWNSLFKKVN